MPWWPESHDVVAAVRDRFGIDVTVLRLLHAPSDRLWGGHVTYLAETDSPPTIALEPYAGDPLADHPLRQVWARPGGPGALSGLGRGAARRPRHPVDRAGPSRCGRGTCRRSGDYRRPRGGCGSRRSRPSSPTRERSSTGSGRETAPRLVAHTRGRVLMAEIPGPSNHDTRSPALLLPMVDLLTDLQERSAQPHRRAGQPRRPRPAAGRDAPPDRRGRRRARVDADRCRASGRWSVLVHDLPRRLGEIDSCGIPDALVHGDFHPGNVGGPVDQYVILDWGDSFVGNPLIDELAFIHRLGPEDAPPPGRRSSPPGGASLRPRTPSVPPTCCARCCPCSPPSCMPTSAPRSNPTSASTTPRTSRPCSAGRRKGPGGAG